MERMEFIKTCLLMGLMPALIKCSPALHIQAVRNGSRLMIPETSVKGSRAIIAGADFPILLIKMDGKPPRAVQMLCSHQGAELSLNGQLLSCPAHDSEFALDGSVIQGPASESLMQFKVELIQHQFIIHLT